MTDARQTPEDPLIKHVREQHNAEPPAHLDAFITQHCPPRNPGAQAKPVATLAGRLPQTTLASRIRQPRGRRADVVAGATRTRTAAPIRLRPGPQTRRADGRNGLSATAALSAPAGAMPAPAPMMEMAAPMQSKPSAPMKPKSANAPPPRPMASTHNCAKSCACANPANRKPPTACSTTCTNATRTPISTPDSNSCRKNDRCDPQPFGIAPQKRALSGHCQYAGGQRGIEN